MKEKFIRFMSGRYGIDRLNHFILMLACIGILLSSLTDIYIFWLAAVILLFISYMRIFSRNISKRYAENQKYLSMIQPIEKWFRLRLKHMKERKTHRFFKCPSCKQKVRVPKGKGNICITCPKCKTQFQKRS